jgi:hypothetical protein
MILGNIFKKFEGIDAAILLVSLSIIIVMIVLFVKKSSKEAFQVSTLTENWWSIKGLDGSPGEAGNDFNLENVKTNTENEVINDMIAKELIVNDGTEAEPNYFPVGIINMKTIIDQTQIKIEHKNIKPEKIHFKLKYTKKAHKSYVKIKYSIPITGHMRLGVQFKLFSGKVDEYNRVISKQQISATHSTASIFSNGASGEGLHCMVPVSIDIIGIDISDEKDRIYFVVIDNYNNDNEARQEDNHGDVAVNDVLSYSFMLLGRTRTLGYRGGKYNVPGYLRASCTIEEIMVPDKQKEAESNFITANIED